MDNKDRQIIRALQHDGRISNRDLAHQVNLSPSPCLRRLRHLEASGAIRNFSADVDPASYGLPILAFVSIRLERHDDDTVRTFEERVEALDEVLECYLLTGGMDYLLRVVIASLEGFEQFVRQKIHPIGGIASMNTSFVYGVVKKTSVFPSLRASGR